MGTVFRLQLQATAPYVCSNTTPPVITSVDSASAYGGYPYFASGSWLEIKGSNMADPNDPRPSPDDCAEIGHKRLCRGCSREVAISQRTDGVPEWAVAAPSIRQRYARRTASPRGMRPTVPPPFDIGAP
jgi:hypothetical protein